jgi:signal transduction histidine kinase
MPNGGKITIIVEEKQSDISIEIIDTGLGIPEEKLNNLFRPFQSTKAKGMGLGLTFCKKTVEAHGGNISVKSERGKGTTFTIVIPTNRDYNTETYMETSVKIKDTLN